MATVVRLPQGFEVPKLGAGYSREALAEHDAAESRLIERVQRWAWEHGEGMLRGKLVRWPWADGYATYVVFRESPLELIHLPVGDAWQLPASWVRGLLLEDVRAVV